MENLLPQYKRPIINYNEPVRNMDYWDDAEDFFDKKQYKKSVLAVINYINPEILKSKNLKKDVELNVVQGSAQMKISITDKFFKLTAPFLKITKKTNKVALLRRVAEINFSPLLLEQICLKQNALAFEYQTDIELAHPDKIYSVLRNTAIYADRYDDMFIEKYQAGFLAPPKYTKLPAKELKKVWQHINRIFDEYTQYSRYFKEKRYDDFIWDIIILSLLKISNMPYVNGKLRVDIIRYISTMINTNIPLNKRIDKGKNNMKKLMSEPKEQWLKNIYYPQWFISDRNRSTKQIIADVLTKKLDSVQQYEKGEKWMDLSYFIQRTLLLLIYYYNLPDNYTEIIHQALEKVSGMEPEEGAPVLKQAMNDLIDLNDDTENE